MLAERENPELLGILEFLSSITAKRARSYGSVDIKCLGENIFAELGLACHDVPEQWLSDPFGW